MDMLTAAILTATKAHEKQLDLGGAPYISHPARIASKFLDIRYQVVGWLHDVVEDTPITLDQIKQTFGEEIAEAVDAISRRKGESNKQYIRRVRQNRIARKVKIFDIYDNMRRDRAPGNERVEANRKVMWESLRMLDAKPIPRI